MIKKSLFLHGVLLSILLYTVSAYPGETVVGGHLKLTLYDYSIGERTFTIVDSLIDSIKNTQKADGARSSGISISRFTLLVMREIKEIFTILVQPNFEVATGATPRVGHSIGEKNTPGGAVFTGWHKAFMRILIPYPLLVEVTGGIIFPRFTMDYGAELFFEDEYNGSKFAISSCLGEMSAIGIEIYKTFELGFASLPTYIYLLNGSGQMYNDNNETPEVMIHIEPEIGPVRLFGSFLGGWHSDTGRHTVLRWSGGTSITMGPVELRSEYAGGKWQKTVETVDYSMKTPAKPHGFYTKLFYQFTPWGKIMLHYNYVHYNFIGYYLQGDPGKEMYSTFTPGLQFNAFDCLSVQLQCDIGNWRRINTKRNTRDKLEFSRFFMGMRATF